jgi:chromosome segregation ATPase
VTDRLTAITLLEERLAAEQLKYQMAVEASLRHLQQHQHTLASLQQERDAHTSLATAFASALGSLKEQVARQDESIRSLQSQLLLLQVGAAKSAQTEPA